MQIEVKYPRIVAGKLLAKGFHKIDDKHADHWFVKGLIKCGDIVVLDQPKVEAPAVEAEKKPAPQSQKKGK
jgi:hypothetical protein